MFGMLWYSAATKVVVFLERCYWKGVDRVFYAVSAEIGTMLGETLEGASRFVADTLEVEESAAEKVRRLESFRPVSLGEAVDKEVAAWHSQGSHSP